MISHLGMNPENGGKPPVDMRVIRINNVIIGALFQLDARIDRVVERLRLSSRNNVSVRII